MTQVAAFTGASGLDLEAGGYAMILGYQLYPDLAEDLAQAVKTELGLPVDTPKALHDGTLDRFERWHGRQIS